MHQARLRGSEQSPGGHSGIHSLKAPVLVFPATAAQAKSVCVITALQHLPSLGISLGPCARTIPHVFASQWEPGDGPGSPYDPGAPASQKMRVPFLKHEEMLDPKLKGKFGFSIEAQALMRAISPEVDLNQVVPDSSNHNWPQGLALCCHFYPHPLTSPGSQLPVWKSCR